MVGVCSLQILQSSDKPPQSSKTNGDAMEKIGAKLYAAETLLLFGDYNRLFLIF